jgi:hypothetical protein
MALWERRFSRHECNMKRPVHICEREISIFLAAKIRGHAPHYWALEIEQHTVGKPRTTRIEPAVRDRPVAEAEAI